MNLSYIKASFKTTLDTCVILWYAALDNDGYAVVWAVIYQGDTISRVIRADKYSFNGLFFEMVRYGVALNNILKEYNSWLCHASECKQYASQLTCLCTERNEDGQYMLDVPKDRTYIDGYLDPDEFNFMMR